jgi:glycosyltransferase involved in cell wall biosynthesis
MYGIRNASRVAVKRLLLLSRHPRVHPGPPFSIVHPLSARPAQRFEEKVSVVIPTRNAGSEIAALIRKLRGQENVSHPEIILVDSGSTDSTLQSASAAGANIVTLPPEQFTHAAARNRGAEAASGQYLLFMVQDALPLSTGWLYEMMDLVNATGAAAISCAEYPRADSDLFYQYLISRRYSQPGLNCDNVTQVDGANLSYLELRSRAVLSNIACLISKSVFDRYRFASAYGEDLELAVRLLRDGRKLGFLHRTRVLHSHNRSAYYFLKRGYVDERALAGIFPDFSYPEIDDKAKLCAEILLLQGRAATLGKLLDQQVYPLSPAKLMQLFWSHMSRGECAAVQNLDEEMICLAELLGQSGDVSCAPLTTVWPHAADHLEGLGAWFAGIYAASDRPLASEMADAMQKILALHSGVHLAYLFMTSAQKRTDESLQRMDNLLRTGV